MGFFRKKAEQRAPAPFENQIAEWQAEDERLTRLVGTARQFRGFTAEEIDRVPIALKSGERIYAIVNGAALVEPRSTGGHWQGGSRGVSVRIPGTKSMRYRVGATKGQYVRAEEKPTIIDQGTAVITDKRVAFAGARQAREWAWAKCLGVQRQPDQPWTAIAVSNRQKTSGILYSDEATEMVRFRLDLAYSVAIGEADDLVTELEAERAEHAAHRPGAPLPPPTAATRRIVPRRLSRRSLRFLALTSRRGPARPDGSSPQPVLNPSRNNEGRREPVSSEWAGQATDTS
jgi:hypothetical protein